MSSRPVLRVCGVAKTLGVSRVLRDVHANFDTSRMHVIVGANGAGKSTLLSLLSGRTAPTRGTISLMSGDGGELATGVALRGVTGWLGHDGGLYGDLTAGENLELHGGIRGIEAGEARSMVGALWMRRVRELSRGQRQRVAIARAMLGRPAVLLLDEPTTGLDAEARRRSAVLLATLPSLGIITIAVTHDPEFIADVGGLVWELRKGELRASPVSRETAQTLSE